MKRNISILASLAALALSGNAQAFKDGYIEWPHSQKFADYVNEWVPGQAQMEDENFFVSRVKPKARFRNTATQVNPAITADTDKKLMFWVPIGNTDNGNENALPNGVFDSEVFNMWPYVTHYGNWSAPQGCVPGAFADVAHKNGVAVSGVSSIPWGGITDDWSEAIEKISELDADKAARYLRYHGVDGLGYNSEFSGGRTFLSSLRTFHAALVKNMREAGNILFENVWYDGTNDNGGISFDQGLGSHNDDTFGDSENVRTSLFFNYNWNYAGLLGGSVTNARNMGRDPLDLYAGINMQGGEPTGGYWTLLKNYPISIGLWGAHSYNMFWESRQEKGSTADAKQRTYQLRTERWFTGGTRNPANTPDFINSLSYSADNVNFHGMSKMMSARSSLKWSLAEEPFITYFNLGNGKFFNWKGVRRNDNEWYNIGVQDYLPTWRWWFSGKFLGGNASDVPANGLDAEFVWDDAYVGGSTMHVTGSTAAAEYLHLFKTEFELAAGDVITLRFRQAKGHADMSLVLSAKGSEATEIALPALAATDEVYEDEWMERTYQVGTDIPALNGKELAVVALKFENAEGLDLYMGEFSIVRAAAVTPATPKVTAAKLLAFNRKGVDAKLIFDMPNDKAAGEPCYNTDVNTSLFKLYVQQEDREPIFMGLTTSWAAMFYAAPIDVTVPNSKVRFGVAAVSLDMRADSETAWSDYIDLTGYVMNDDIQKSKNIIKPGEDFVLSYVDPNHEAGTWQIVDGTGKVVFEATGHTVEVSQGVSETGSYTLVVNGMADDGNGNRVQQERRFSSYVQITGTSVGALPKILTLTANGSEADIEVKADEELTLAYTGREADGSGSRGVDLKEQFFGTQAGKLGVSGGKTFSVAFWLKINEMTSDEYQLFSVSNQQQDTWPKNNWGWIWNNINGGTGRISCYTFRGKGSGNNELRYYFDNSTLSVGTWNHLAYVFEYNAEGDFHSDFYINGVKQESARWDRSAGASGTGDPGWQSGVDNINDYHLLAVGGTAAFRSAFGGVIDNFQVYDKALTADEVKTAMGDLDPSNLPQGLVGYWDFESDADAATGSFANQGSVEGAVSGSHEYVSEADSKEGQGGLNWIAPSFTSGCPFVSGTAYPVVTTPQWTANRAQLQVGEGSDTEGTAKVSYVHSGDYTVTLTLSNAHGSDSKTFSFITVGGANAVDNVAASELRTYVVDGAAIVEFAEAGNYSVRVYGVNGALAAQKAQAMAAGTRMTVSLGNVPGAYVVEVKKDGKTVKTVKLLNR